MTVRDQATAVILLKRWETFATNLIREESIQQNDNAFSANFMKLLADTVAYNAHSEAVVSITTER
jgi:hypothetical protein